jgi:putative membrane protein
MITFAAPGLYSFYDTAPRLWGIGLADDQQFAGLLMWAAVPVVYLTVLSVIFLRWAGREEAKDRATPAQRVVPKPDTASFP